MSALNNENSGFPKILQPGHDAKIGSHHFAAEEMIAFAKLYDPLDIHIDPQAASRSMIGALCASGWHTCCMWMRKHRDYSDQLVKQRQAAGLPPVRFGPSPGLENIQWPKPVFADDTITYFNKTLECRPSKSKPGWHILKFQQRGENQHGDIVLKCITTVMVQYPA